MRRRILLLILVAGIVTGLVSGSYAADDPIEAYVERLYVLVLGRSPDPPGLEHNVNFTLGQGNVNDITKTFFTCPEFLGGRGADDYNFIESLYLVALTRYPDQAGWEHHVNLIRTGQMTREELIDGFLATPEFVSKDPFRNGAYVITDLYGYYEVVSTITRDDTGTYFVPTSMTFITYFDPSDPLAGLEMSISTSTGYMDISVSSWATSPTTFRMYGVMEFDGSSATLTGEGQVYPDRSYSLSWTWEYRVADDPNVYYLSAFDAGTPI